jgi:predicted aspartyl protease
MPILHIQVSGHGIGPNGQPIPIEPRQLLAMRGPVVQVAIRVPPEIAARLTSEGRPIPAPIVGFGLIDSGAASSCIDNAAAQSLGLPVVNVISMASATHASVETNVYPIAFDILGGAPLAVNSPRTAGAALANQGLVLLIGRDLLANAIFSYNGITGEFTLCF